MTTPIDRRHSRAPRPHRRRVRAHRAAAGPRAEPDRARHLLGDVVGALQLQELARPSADAADRPARACCRARARTPAPSTSATAWRRSSRSSRTTIRRSSSRTRARRPASAASSATSSRWARGRSRCSNSLRFGPLDEPAHARRIVEGVGRRHRRLRQLHRHSDRRRRDRVRRALHRQSAGQRLLPRHRAGTMRSSRARPAGVGNPVYYVGAKTGRDGIHGATMASAEFDEKSAEKRPAVQVGDPFMEKLLLEACLEVMETDALVGIQDMGAAGLTCSTCEMGARGGVGVEIDVALRAAARDRHDARTRSCCPNRRSACCSSSSAAAKRKSSASSRSGTCTRSQIGEVTDDGLLRVQRSRRRRRRDSQPRADRRGAGLPAADARPGVARRTCSRLDLDACSRRDAARRRALLTLLASPTIASKRWIYRQYDHMVRTNTVAPAGHGRRRRAREGHRPRAGDVGRRQRPLLLPRSAARRELAVAEAARNVACAGARADRRDQLPELRQSRAAGDHVAVRARRSRHRRRLPRARHADHRRQRQPLQRDRRPARSIRRRSSAWSASSRTRRRVLDRALPRPRATSSCCSATTAASSAAAST